MVLTIGLDEKTSHQLEQLARVRSTEPAKLAHDAIRTFLRDEGRRIIEQESKAFQRLHPELLRTMPGEFVAVHHGQMVDHDSDQLALFRRVEEAYGGQPVLIRQVRPEIEQTIEVLSPRLEYA
ncbi:MAG TPA: hypothetical protein VL334_25740 [Anaerolineae bacterium]|nr:hypothetical protein [Anaerolineae bacterium]